MILLFILLFLNYDLLLCQHFYTEMVRPLEKKHMKINLLLEDSQLLDDRTKPKQIERRGQMGLAPAISSVRDQLLDMYRSYIGKLNINKKKKDKKAIDGDNEPKILKKGNAKKPDDNTSTSQESSKETDSELDKNEKNIRKLKKNMHLRDLRITILPNKPVTPDKDDSTTEERENGEERDVKEDSSTDEKEEENVTAEKFVKTTTVDDKTIESKDESDKTLIIDGIDDAKLGKFGDILNMERERERERTKKQRFTKAEDEIEEHLTSTKRRRKKTTKTLTKAIFNFDFLKPTTEHVKKIKKPKHETLSTHKKLKLKMTMEADPVTDVYKTKHKRLQVNNLIKELANIPEEPSTHKDKESDDAEDTSSVTTPAQVNIKRTHQTTTTMLPYFQMIEDLKEGYMVVFLMELMRIMASKDKDDLFEVLVHTEQIALQLRETGKIIWLGQPLLHVTMKLAKFMTEAETGVIQKYASKLKRKISRRHQELSSEVNTIIDYADMLYDDEEGTQLFTALKDFDDYPNTTQPSDAVCLALMESFLKPYRRLSNTELRQQLVDSINMELRAKMPEGERLQDISLGFLGINEAIEQRPPLESESDSIPLSRKSQKQMRQKLQKTRTKHSTMKQELTTFQPGYSDDIYRRRLSYTSDNRYQYPMLRNMKPITSIQRRFKIVTPHRHMLRLRSTRSYIVNLISRPTKEVTTKLIKAKKTNQVTTRFPLFHEAIRFRSHLNQKQGHRI
ncbi:uncharacterized protein LOC118281267 [Spodoptera frugiperda]|uniref:Uncharacterized protein LOC118281267 n=1 Tax=Spodoptera frugiperda TaxID=7108 RepID=A0A9R0DK44_SPOFR|nr:uncharacterized protein LOC118281267 [Spodoptera frugiperda]